MRRAGTLTLSTFLAVTALSGAALAKAEYVAYIPNGNVNGCLNCHPGNNTNALNVFAQDASNQEGKPTTQWWPSLQDLDSDGDGQTNGEELGDPCGDWLIGLDPPRATAISNPGDPNSKSADPDSPPCGGGGAGGAGQGGSQGGAATTTTSSTTGAGGVPTGSGQGAGAPKSTGAGKADPPVYTQNGSCSTTPGPGPDWAFGLLVTMAVYLSSRSRRVASRSRNPR